jgi:hypothetical protein
LDENAVANGEAPVRLAAPRGDCARPSGDAEPKMGECDFANAEKGDADPEKASNPPNRGAGVVVVEVDTDAGAGVDSTGSCDGGGVLDLGVCDKKGDAGGVDGDEVLELNKFFPLTDEKGELLDA